MIFKPSEEERAIIFLKKMFEKKRWVKIDFIPESKTLSQLAYIWVVFASIAEDTGNTPKDIYELFLEMFPTYKEIMINGEIKRIQITMSAFTKEQESLFIDRVVTYGRQEGYRIPDPSDKEAIAQYNYYKQKGLL
jgi:hypothetical protein